MWAAGMRKILARDAWGWSVENHQGEGSGRNRAYQLGSGEHAWHGTTARSAHARPVSEGRHARQLRQPTAMNSLGRVSKLGMGGWAAHGACQKEPPARSKQPGAHAASWHRWKLPLHWGGGAAAVRRQCPHAVRCAAHAAWAVQHGIACAGSWTSRRPSAARV